MSKVLKRQGDVLLERIADDLAQLKLADVMEPTVRVVTDGVIARGETSGHAHVLSGGSLIETPLGQLAVAGESTSVEHDEHDSLEIEPGVWLVRHQIEYGGDGQNVAVYD